ncbi:hypothetical protein PtA15_13A191 [Puccinia triticina]|uniref:BTB domain-containing protein n=1 Tax=Puccinia triticina TaxID=208348 RepID=A0ABY7D796_9BASI|nr:uncharacterized protein PtA15_13A191 [Puccinia triticina]WAQ90792.1 hypothetical protein PtA15_13A191 [Puccinia triticina]
MIVSALPPRPLQFQMTAQLNANQTRSEDFVNVWTVLVVEKDHDLFGSSPLVDEVDRLSCRCPTDAEPAVAGLPVAAPGQTADGARERYPPTSCPPALSAGAVGDHPPSSCTMSQQLAPGGQPGPTTWPAHPRPWPRPLLGPPMSYPTGLSQASVDGKPIGQPRGRPNDTLTNDPQAPGELPATRPPRGQSPCHHAASHPPCRQHPNDLSGCAPVVDLPRASALQVLGFAQWLYGGRLTCTTYER